MSKLILPNQLTIPRRGFIKGTGIALASLFAGPAIASYENLMDIDTKQNRLVVAYVPKLPSPLNPHGVYMSLLNATDILNPEIYKSWQEHCSYNEYNLVRRAEVTHDIFSSIPLQKRKRDLQMHLNVALIRYKERHQLIQV